MMTELQKMADVYKDMHGRKKRRKRVKVLLTDMLLDYFQNSTLHGLRYIAERGLNIIERLFWFTTFVASIIICAYLIHDTYIKWKTSPVIVTVNGRLASVGTVPFPTVTICPDIKVKKSVYDYTAAYKIHRDKMQKRGLKRVVAAILGKREAKFDDGNDKIISTKVFENNSKINHDEDDLDKLKNINSMCDYERWFPKDVNISNNLVRDITEVALTPEDIFVECKWYNEIINCADLFSRVYTGEGVCYTFNNLASTDIFTDNIQQKYRYLESKYPMNGWSSEKGEYFQSSIESPYPRRGRVYGLDSDLEVILAVNTNEQDKECNALFSAYKVFLHHPMDLPTSSLYYYAVLPNETTSIAISFHQLNTDKNLMNSKTIDISAEIRQCYFQNERPLRYFKLYTASNCRAECLSNYTYSVCNCVAFYMPHHNSDEICSQRMRICLEKARAHMAYKERRAELGVEENDQACMCRPSCDSIEYDAELLKTKYILTPSSELRSLARVQLFFKKPQFVTMQRRELFGVTDFLANIGGLLGLFLGFSILSIVEIIYFLTLRVGIKLRRDQKQEKRKKKPEKQKGIAKLEVNNYNNHY